MIKRVIKIILSLSGFALGIFFIILAKKLEIINLPEGVIGISVYILSGLLFAIITFIISPKVMDSISKMTKKLEKELEDVPTNEIILGAAGLIIGLVIAFFISQPFYSLPYVGTILSILVYLVMGYLGIRLAVRSKGDLIETATRLKFIKDSNEIEPIKLEVEDKSSKAYKILDTSVIIDGRIADIIDAGFIEGTIVIPNFVLLELQHIADSSDDLRRERGRRGLDVLKVIQNHPNSNVIISHDPYDEIEEVDSKLLELTKDLEGKIVTNDYNLNKVAEVRGIKVLNINELANAVKAPVIHGETITVSIVKEGSAEGQGVAYLDDGTMIVVEGGKDYVGENKSVVVTSVIQTSAGKMIFTKIK